MEYLLLAWPFYVIVMTVLYILVLRNPRKWHKPYRIWSYVIAIINIFIPGIMIFAAFTAAMMNDGIFILWIFFEVAAIFGPLGMRFLACYLHAKKFHKLGFTISYIPYVVLMVLFLLMYLDNYCRTHFHLNLHDYVYLKYFAP